MQTRNKIFDDLSQLMTNAMGVAQGAKDEANTAFNGMIDRNDLKSARKVLTAYLESFEG